MTIGQRARRRGVPIERLRAYQDAGLISTVGQLPPVRRGRPVVPRGGRLPVRTGPDPGRDPATWPPSTAVRRRIDARLTGLHQLQQRLDAFETQPAAELGGQGDVRAHDAHQSRRPA